MSHSNDDGRVPEPHSPQRSLQSNPIELHSASLDEEGEDGEGDLPPACACFVSCWRVCSWLVSIVLYILEILVLAWAAFTYGNSDLYLLFGLTLAYLPLPTVILATVSLVWYYNLDRYHRRRRDRDPHDLSLGEYKKKLTGGAIALHVFMLGMVYRYGQLIYLTILGKKRSLPYLRRDTAFLRFLHSTIISAPQLVIHLYAIQVAYQLSLTDESSTFIDPLDPPVLAALSLCALSLFYAVTSFTTNDRLSGKRRRVILPAHIFQSLWYLCVITSRVIALAIFAYSHGFWVYVLVGGHWVLMFLFLLVQRTSFCADIEEQISEDGSSSAKPTIKRRWSLEVPFYFVAATVYIFTFFNMKHGKSWYLLAPYHVVMFAENVAMGVLFYIRFSDLVYAEAALSVVAGLYPVGMLFMVVYYCLCHPGRTEDCYWMGVPRSCSGGYCCSCCCSTNKQGRDSIGFQNRASVTISGPTLISHNGFLPDNMIPAGVPSSPPPQDIGEVVGGGTSHQRTTRGGMGMETDQRTGEGLHHRPEARNPLSSLATVSPDSANENSNYGPRSLTTPSESNRSNPVFSDASQFLPSELDTDGDSNLVHGEGVHVDTVIDSPLVGFTPEPFDLHAVQMLQRNGRLKSVESQKADTNDTGIDVESADAVLTSGITTETGGASGKPEDSTGRHQFPNIPAKKKNYLSERSKLEQHYFPEEKQHQQRNRDSGSVTPTLPTPNWSQSPASTSPHSGRATWGQRMSDSSPERHRRNTTPGTVSSQSYPSPERLRRGTNAPRSPKGAKAFTINPQGATNYHSDGSEGWSGYPAPAGHDRRQVAPRSPKGAKRLIITPQLSASSSASAQFSGTQQQPPFTGNVGQMPERPAPPYYPPSPHRSPARQPRGAGGGHTYQQHSSPERRAGVQSGARPPQHTVPRYTITTATNQSYPAHMSPSRRPGGMPPNYHQSQSSGEASGIQNNEDDLQWDSWTAENTHINAAQAAATTHLRVEGGGGGGGGVGGVGRSTSLLHKEMSPSSRSESAADVERNRSFNVPRKPLNINPYYSPGIPKRSNVDSEFLQGSNYPHPQIRRPAADGGGGGRGQQLTTAGLQHHYPRHSGEYNPRFSTELDNRLHVPGQERISESYPSPGVARGPPVVVHRSPQYPRSPQGASARAPRMARSPPDKRLKSMSPQRSIISYGSGVSGAWPPAGEGGVRGGVSGGVRPNSVHNSSAFSPQHRRLHHPPGAGVRHSDGASAVAWIGPPSMHWTPTAAVTGGRRSPRLNPVLHVPRSSAHESAV